MSERRPFFTGNNTNVGAGRGKGFSLDTKIGLASLLVAVVIGAVQILQNWRSDDRPAQLPPSVPTVAFNPREHLYKGMGISWNEENFWDAIKRGDQKAVQLFLEDGMSINGERLHQVLLDPLLRKKAPLALLAEAHDRNAEFCSSDDVDLQSTVAPEHRRLSRFRQYLIEESAFSFVSRFCKGTGLGKDLLKIQDAERDRIGAEERENADQRDRVKACVDRFRNADIKPRQSLLMNNSIGRERKLIAYSCHLKTKDDPLLASFCESSLLDKALVMRMQIDGGAQGYLVGLVSAEGDLLAFCQGHFRERAIDRVLMEKVGLAIRKLS